MLFIGKSNYYEIMLRRGHQHMLSHSVTQTQTQNVSKIYPNRIQTNSSDSRNRDFCEEIIIMDRFTKRKHHQIHTNCLARKKYIV